MSFLKKLFGGKDGDAGKADKPAAETVYNGYAIAATPIAEGGQFRVAANITMEVDGEMREHRLIRADTCSSADEAAEIALRKSKQMIDERGTRIFDA